MDSFRNAGLLFQPSKNGNLLITKTLKTERNMSETKPKQKKITIRELQRKMRDDEQIVQMAIYDYRSAVIADRLGIDILCVSDTGGM
ncbi:MAG: hypothetical protein ACI9KN_000359, partial [Gammaproteobacteria bacterium]